MFKYAKVDDYTVANLRQHQIYCRHFEDFNDPFECWIEEVREVPIPKTERDRFSALVKAWGYMPKEDNESDMEMYRDYVDSLSTYPSSKLEQTKESARIACFSNTADNLLMWAHYGDGLRGFCLEFDPVELVKGTPDGAEILDVQYRADPAIFDRCLYEVALDQVEWHEDQIDQGNAARDGLEEAFREHAANSRKIVREIYSTVLGTKPMEWHYEHESRLVVQTNVADRSAMCFLYPVAAIKSVTLGDRMSLTNRDLLVEIVREQGMTAPIRTASRDSRSFTLTHSELC